MMNLNLAVASRDGYSYIFMSPSQRSLTPTCQIWDGHKLGIWFSKNLESSDVREQILSPTTGRCDVSTSFKFSFCV